MVEITRRHVLKAASALSATGLSVTGSSVTGLARGEQARGSWDREVDVVVVGAATGLAAAIVAATANLEVLVLEKAAFAGGNMLVSGGLVWVPNNPIMKREGIADSREQALVYLRHLAQDQAEESLLEAFVDRGSQMLEFFEAHTPIRWRVSQVMRLVTDYHPTWPGSVIRGRSLEIVQPAVTRSGGLLVSALLEAAGAKGVEVLTSTPARRLIAREHENGREVLGVIAEQDGKPLRIRARRGVLISSGGFERNWEMKRHFLRSPSPYTLGSVGNTGDGIHMGMDVGADLRNMNTAWGIIAYKAEAEQGGHVLGGISTSAQKELRNAGGICVNRYGERFSNEAADYASSWRTYAAWENWGENRYRNLPAYSIFDQSAREGFTIAGQRKEEPLPPWVQVADTLPALARKLGIDVAGLMATVKRFNANAAAGFDPDFHRGETAWDLSGGGDIGRTLAPLARGPFYGAEVTPADLGTCGGLRVDANARVIDVFDRPIERLFAAGNTAGVGGPGALYGGAGGTLGPGLTFSYIAGVALSKLPPSTES